MIGKVAMYDRRKGWGFILPNDISKDDVFFHRSALSKNEVIEEDIICRPAPVMKRDSASFPFPQIHIAFVTTPISSQRRQAGRLCKANHSSI